MTLSAEAAMSRNESERTDETDSVIGVRAAAEAPLSETWDAQMDAMRARAEAAESELVERAQFLAVAEHRMKTPLTVLYGTALTLRDRRDQLPDEARIELEESMVRNVLALTRELENLLVEARADVRSHALHPAIIDLRESAGEIASAFNGISEAHEVIVDAPRPVMAYADPTAVNQVLGHLLDNAVKYSPNGGRVIVRAMETLDGVALDVVDEGVGLPQQIDVFQPFRRGEGETEPGIGLGLHIVRNLVEAMGGAVSARDNDKGATFSVRLPARDAHETSEELDQSADAVVTLAYYDAEGRLVDSEEVHIPPDPGSVWIKPSSAILSWPIVRTVRASLTREPKTPVDIQVHLLPVGHPAKDGDPGRPGLERYS